MSAPTGTASDSVRPASEAARVSFRQPVITEAHIDAAWWPRSHDLAAELPALLDVLWTASRNVNRVSFAKEAWLPTPRRLSIEGREVRLGGFIHQDPALISLRDARGNDRLDVLVIPPETDPAIAGNAMDAAGRSGRNVRASAMLEQAADARSSSTSN
jgi:hypothetical protein